VQLGHFCRVHKQFIIASKKDTSVLLNIYIYVSVYFHSLEFSGSVVIS